MAITFNNSQISIVGTSDTTVIDNTSGSSKILVYSAIAANIASPAATATVSMAVINGGTRTSIISSGVVPSGSALSAISNKAKVTLVVGDKLVISSGTPSSLSLVTSYISGLN